MALITKAIKGTKDVLPFEVHKNQYIEATCLTVAENFGFKEMRTPVFEHTELFQRGVGDTTDVVQKEMYTFDDKGGRSITLRPEGTAGAARSFLENGLSNAALPQKICYLTSCYRYEKPQAGRLREFHQFGVECFGASSPLADAEIISLAKQIFDELGVKDLKLEINSIGCPECRAKYHEALKEYFSQYKEQLCHTCRERIERNPMRLLDCKSPEDKALAENAPEILDYLCDECREHFDKVKAYLDAMNIEYTVNPKIVRGLDYYTKTVFEFIAESIGAQGTVCGGCRYDGLVETLGGKPTPALGFAMGLERILLTMEAQGCEFMEEKTCDLYIAAMGEAAAEKTVEIVTRMRDEGFFVEYDLVGRGLKAQMKYADKIKAKYVIVLGDSELESGSAKLKNMATGEQTDISLGEELLDDFGAQYYELMMSTDDDFRSFVEAFADNGDDK